MVVDVVPVKPLKVPVTLAQIKADPKLQKIPLVTHSRLSVMPLEKSDFERILELGKHPPDAEREARDQSHRHAEARDQSHRDAQRAFQFHREG